MKQFSTLCVVLFLFVSAAYPQQKDALSPLEIINRMISVYASADSYVDEGEVRTIFLEPSGRRTKVLPFTTAFVRPSDFRFEYKDRRGEDEWNRYVVWKGGESVKTWWSLKPEVQSPESLSRAIAGATGVSGGSAHTVPALLMTDLVTSHRFKRLSDLKLIGEEQVNGRNAYKIEGTEVSQKILTLWVDKEAFLLLKTFQKNKFEKFETEKTTTYKPQINVKVAQEKLALNLPAN